MVIGRNVLFLFQSLGHTPETEIEILLGIQGAVNSPKPKSRVDSHGLGLEAVRINMDLRRAFCTTPVYSIRGT